MRPLNPYIEIMPPEVQVALALVSALASVGIVALVLLLVGFRFK